MLSAVIKHVTRAMGEPRWRTSWRELALAWLLALGPRLISMILGWDEAGLEQSAAPGYRDELVAMIFNQGDPPLHGLRHLLYWTLSGGSRWPYLGLLLAEKALLAPLALLLTRSLGLPRLTSWCAVALAALLPPLLSPRFLWPYGLTTVIFTAWWAALAQFTFRDGRPWRGALVALLAALVFLDRPAALPAIACGYAFVVAPLLWRRVRGEGGDARTGSGWTALLISIAAFALLLGGVSMMNQWRLGRASLTSCNKGKNLYHGLNPHLADTLPDPRMGALEEVAHEHGYPQVAFAEALDHPDFQCEIDRAMARAAGRWVLEHPGAALSLMGWKSLRFWSGTLLVGDLASLRAGPDDPPLEEASDGIEWRPLHTFYWFHTLLFLGCVLMWRAGQRLALAFLLLLPVVYWLTHLPFDTITRYRAHVDGVLVVPAAVGLAWIVERVGEGIRRVRGG
jgi:hypothetical protein